MKYGNALAGSEARLSRLFRIYLIRVAAEEI